jgi:O-antigen ligase
MNIADIQQKKEILKPVVIINIVRVLLCFFLLSYYLIPRSCFDVLSRLFPSLHPRSSITFLCICSVIYCGAIIASMAVFVEKNIIQSKNAINKFDIPVWLPIVVWMIPIVAALIQWRQYSDFALPICSVILSFCAGIFASLLAGSTRNMIHVFALIVLIQGVFALLLRRIFANVVLSGTVWREGGTFHDPNALAFLCSIGVVMGLVSIALGNQKQGEYLYCSITTAIAAVALFSTWNRGAVLALALALMWFGAKYMSSKLVRCLIIVFMCLLLIFVQYRRSEGRENAASANQSAANRVAIWQAAAKEYTRHWLVGSGVSPVMIIRIDAPTSKSEGRSVLQTLDGPKNVVLYFLNEFGITGGVILVLGYLCIHGLLAAKEVKDSPNAIVISISWIFIVLYSLVDTAFGGPSQYCGNAVVGCLYGTTILLGRNCFPEAKSAPLLESEN